MIKVATYNIAGIVAPSKWGILLRFCLDNELDIICLQEVSISESVIISPHYDMIANVGPNKRGTAVLLRKGVRAERTLLEPEGRLTAVQAGGIMFVCIYAPSGDQARQKRNEFFRRTIPAYVAMTKNPVVVLGDFNAIEEPGERATLKGNDLVEKHCTSPALKELRIGLQLTDIWRKFHKNEPGWTFRRSNTNARLDRIYAQEQLKFSKISVDILPMGDHAPVIGHVDADLAGTPVAKPKTSSVWKLNCAILSEEEYGDFIKSYISDMAMHPLRERDVGKWWDQVLKPGLKEVTIQYCSRRALKRRKMHDSLQRKLRETVNAPTLDWTGYQSLRQEFQSWERSALDGYGVRSRVAYVAEEESSIFHVHKAHKNYQKTIINKLTTEDGITLTQEDEIKKEITKHFTRMFKNQELADTSLKTCFLEGIRGAVRERPTPFTQPIHNSVDQATKASVSSTKASSSNPGSEAHINNIESPISLDEILAVLKQMKKNKSPGLDGIPYEFYETFWDVIGPHFLAMVHHVLERGAVLQSQGKAAVRLIPKIPNPVKITDYRPIALLNTDYKTIAAVLASRLRRTLPQTLRSHQKGGVPGRYIFDSLCLFRDVIGHVKATGSEPTSQTRAPRHGAIIAFDLEKAFDLVNREVLWEIMQEMGYPERFLKWLRAMYASTQLCALNSSSIVSTIDDVQSVRQGCPLSIHLFALYVEPLLVKISDALTGIDIHGHRVAVRAFVDDLVVFASNNRDIKVACDIVELFCRWTKARVNKNKTKVLGLGDWACSTTVTQGEATGRGKQQKTSLSMCAHRQPANSGSAPTSGHGDSGSIPTPGGSRKRSLILGKPSVKFRKWPVSWLAEVQSIKLLGIEFQADLVLTARDTWDEKIKQMHTILITNSYRRFTFYGRVLFTKQHVISKAVHLAHVFPCNKSRAETIRENIGSFLWAHRYEHPALPVLVRPHHQGGLGAILPFYFFQSLYTRQIFKSLISPEGPEKAVLAYWLAHPLSRMLPKFRTLPSAKERRMPDYIKTAIPTIEILINTGLFTTSNANTHRVIYLHLIASSTDTGRIEKKMPQLDWPSVWRWVASIKGKHGELVWDFNHNQLPSQLRQLSLHHATSNICPLCTSLTASAEETDEHLMLECKSREAALGWLKEKMAESGCVSPLHSAIRGDVGSCPKPTQARRAVMTYIVVNWEARKHHQPPTVSELSDFWEALQHHRK